MARRAASPTTGSQPWAAMAGAPGPSGTEVTDQAGAVVWARSLSKGRCRRGKPRPDPGLSAPHVWARVAANEASSSSRSAARSRIRLGSSSSSCASAPSRSGRTCSAWVSHGSQDSMPSNTRPPASFSHCSRPQGSAPTRRAARSRTSSVGTSSLQPKTSAWSRSEVERWSLGSKLVSRSTSSPHRSTRTGASAVEGKTSTMPPRTASSPRCSTWYSRR